MFRIGQKVVCVNVLPRRDGLHPWYDSTVIPTLGGVYTIRDIFDGGIYGHDEPGLLLIEIVNPVRRYISRAGSCECEQFWLANRFRPLHPTNIDVFTKMLEPVPVPVRDLVVSRVMCQLTPEALLEAANRAADLPAEERSRRRGEYEAYRNKKLGLAGVAPEMKALAPRLSSQGKVNR